MTQANNDKVYLTKLEVAILHFIASRPELLARMGYTSSYVQMHVPYGIRMVRNSLADLVTLGLAQHTQVKNGLAGKPAYLFTFDHALVSELSKRYMMIDNFSITETERIVIPVLGALFCTPTLKQSEAVNLTRFPNIDHLVQKYPILIKREGWGGSIKYKITDKGCLYFQTLTRIQQTLATTKLT